MVLHEETGLLVPEGNVEQLAEMLVFLADDPLARRSLGLAARQTAH